MRQSAFADREARGTAHIRASSKRVAAIFLPCGQDALSGTEAAFGGHEKTRNDVSPVFRATFAARRLLCPAKRVFVSRCLPEPKVGMARRRLTKVDWNWNIKAAFNVLQFDLQVKTTMRHSGGNAARQASVVRDRA